MSSREAAAPAPTAAAVVARLSWGMPFAALLLVGLSERSGPPFGVHPDSLVLAAEVTAVLGVAFGAAALLAASRGAASASSRRTALFGTGASVVVIAVTQVALLTGAASARQAERELHAALGAALHDLPGWNGGASVDGATVFAVELGPTSSAAKLLQRDGETYRVVMFGVNNASGQRPLRLEVGKAVAVGPSGPLVRGLSSEDAAGHLRAAANETGAQDSAVVVPPGGTVDGIMALFDPRVSFEGVVALGVRVNGVPRRIPGRYFTMAEKRAIDARRSVSPAPSGAPGP